MDDYTSGSVSEEETKKCPGGGGKIKLIICVQSKQENTGIKQQTLCLIDLEALVPKEEKYFIDNTHLSELGNELVSKILLDEIQWEINFK